MDRTEARGVKIRMTVDAGPNRENRLVKSADLGTGVINQGETIIDVCRYKGAFPDRETNEL